MDREAIAFAALKPVDFALGTALNVAKATGQLEPVVDGFYKVAGKVLRQMYEKQNDLRAEGTQFVPQQGGAIFASNHQSWNDVQVIGATCPRRVRFLAKGEFKTWPVLRHLIALSDSPFISRGGDTQGMKYAVDSLKEGKALVIFPEGTIPGEETIMRHEVEPDTGLLRGHTGAVRMAIAAGVPIVPVGVTGTGKSFPPEVYPRLELLEAPKPVPVIVRYGEPIHYTHLHGTEPTAEVVKQLTHELMLAISKLVDHEKGFVPVKVPVPPLPRYEKVGVLLLHGFTSSVRTVDGLAPRLEAAGLAYKIPVMRGHGTRYQDLAGVRAQDWYDDAEAALLELAKSVDKVVVVGLSMGGLVALNLAMRHPDKIAGVVTLAAALRFQDPLAPVAPALSRFVKSWPSPEAFRDQSLKHTSQNYPKFMTAAFGELLAYARETERRLPQVKVPICVVHSKRDQVVKPLAANLIYRDVGSEHREIHWFFKSGHEMGQDCERDAVFDTVMEFVGKHCKPAK
ncbi:MAG TPA: alpha/beta fold hydrolase [Myxococcales bacterium]|jgi:carboxylesterase